MPYGQFIGAFAEDFISAGTIWSRFGRGRIFRMSDSN